MLAVDVFAPNIVKLDRGLIAGINDNIDMQEKDGTIVNLGEKFGNKKGH